MWKGLKQQMQTLGRRISIDSNVNETLKTFKHMVSDIKKKTTTERDCVMYFLENYGRYSLDELKELKIEKENNKLVRKYTKFVTNNFDDISLLGEAIAYLKIAIQIYSGDNRANHNLFQLILKIFDSDDIGILDLSSDFLHASIENKSLANYMFSGQPLADLWYSAFCVHCNTNQFVSAIFIGAASIREFKSLEHLQPIINTAIEVINTSAMLQKNATSALTFLGIVIHSQNTHNFLPTIMPILVQLAPIFTTLQFFENFLSAPSDDSNVVWKTLNTIINDPSMTPVLLKSAIIAVHNANSDPPECFSFRPFVSLQSSFPPSIQKMLFDLVARAPLKNQTEFICATAPLEETKIDTTMLSDLMHDKEWGEHLEAILQSLLLTADPKILFDRIANDQSVYVITSTLLDQINSESAAAIGIFSKLLSFAVDGLDVVAPFLSKISQRIDPEFYMDGFIGYLQTGKMPDFVLSSLTPTVRKSDRFFKKFRELGGCKFLGELTHSHAGLDFLAALASDGPHGEIDEFVKKEFETCGLKDFDQVSLVKLMFGVAHDSRRHGCIVIPSLCPYVDWPVLTPYDKYMLGTVGTKFVKFEKKHYVQTVGRVIQSGELLRVTDDPELLTAATDVTNHHVSLWQFNPGTRNCKATMKWKTSISFWIHVFECHGKSTVMNYADETIELNPTGLKIFGNEELVPFELKVWHLVTMVASTMPRKTVLYIDAQKVAEIPKTSDIIILGSDLDLNTIWYLSECIYSSSNEFTEADMNKQIERNYFALSKTDVVAENGVKYVPYRGIGKYIHALGGPESIFLRLIKCESSDDFLLYLQSAFDLINLRLLTKSDFILYMRYILCRNDNLYIPQLEQVILQAFIDNERMQWDFLCGLLCDFEFLSSKNIQMSFVPRLFTERQIPEYALSIMDYMFDAFVFFELTDTAEANFMLLVSLFIEAHPSVLRKLMLLIEGIPHCETDDLLEIYDETAIAKQTKLFNALIQYQNLFVQEIPAAQAFAFTTRIPSELALRMLAFLADICCSYPNWFDIRAFKNAKPTLRANASEVSLWLTMFCFLTEKRTENIDGYMAYDVKRPKVFPVMLSLVCDLLPHDISAKKGQDCLSFNILNLLYAFVTKEQLKFSEMIGSIQRLCCFGFDEREPSPLPFSLNTETSKPLKLKRKVSITNSFRKSFGNEADLSGTSNIIELSHSLFPKVSEYISNTVFNDDLVETKLFEYPSLPDDFEEFVQGNVGQLVCMLASKALIEASSDINEFKKALIKLTIFGADVIPEVSIIMHRRVILFLLSESSGLPADVMEYLVSFITFRLLEGWWANNVEVLYDSVANVLSRAMKSAPNFLLAVFAQVGSASSAVRIASSLIRNPIFLVLKDNDNFVNGFLRMFTTNEVCAQEGVSKVWEMLLAILPQSEIVEALNTNTLQNYLENAPDTFFESYKELVAEAQSKATTINRTRIQNSRHTRHQKRTGYIRAACTQVALVRRAMRFEFFWRLNTSSLKVDRAIAKLFKEESLEQQIANPSKKVMVSSSGHPLCVPQKLLPCGFEYEIVCEKVKTDVKQMPRSHHLHDFDTKIDELKIEQMAAKCLEGWHLPVFVPYGLLELAKEHYKGHIFTCSMLVTPELLPCVGIIGDNAITFIMYASITDDTLILHENSQLLCHYALIESTVKGFSGRSSLFANHPTISIDYRELAVIIPRRFAHEEKAIDIFTTGGMSIGLVLPESERKLILSKASKKSQPLVCLGPRFSQSLLMSNPESVAQMWTQGKLSTMEYLLYLNAASGRSFNDFSQYPVFPWVIADYTSEDAPHAARDLSKPMGMQTEKRAEKFLMMYEETEPEKYHFGTHYSYPAAVLHFMMRLEPFTLYNVMLHNGFDHRDRLFCDVSESWRSASEANQADVKELIPQFYALPCMFENLNQLPLDRRTDGHELSTVALPPWADGSADFVHKMREALEHEETSKRLPDWIDLVFGYKQRGSAAVAACNVFHPRAYDRGDGEQGDLDAVNNFGQCPMQLFNAPHPSFEATEHETLVTKPVRFCELKPLSAEASEIVIDGDEVFGLPRFVHRCAGFALEVSNNVFKTEHIQYDPSLFDITDTCVSKDSSILCVASDSGFIHNYLVLKTGPHFTLGSRCCAPGEFFKVVAVSTHIGVVAAATPFALFVFDLSTGLMMARTETTERVSKIVIDDSQPLIIAASGRSIYVYDINLTKLASAESPIGVTALAASDSLLWTPTPFYVTGHVDGSIVAWIFEKSTLSSLTLAISRGSPISAITIFNSGSALIAADIDGASFLCAVGLGKGILKMSMFTKCSICGGSMKGGSTCSHCGFPICKSCIKDNQGKVCTVCEGIVSSEARATEETK